MPKRRKVNFRSIGDLNDLVLDSIPRLPNDLTLIVGVPRSGCLVASMIALYLNLPYCSFNEYLQGYQSSGGRRAEAIKLDSAVKHKVLVVDDSVSSGWEMRRIREQFEHSGITHETLFLAAYVTSKGKDLVHLYLELIDPPQIFEWNLYHHPHLQKSCFDIDGVLCRDATKKEDDDGPRYKSFLTNVEPRIIPSVKIGWLVTSRLEKYRAETEDWMKKHHVQYEHLIMQDLPDLAQRRQSNSDARFKAEVYGGLKEAFFFVESSARQAREIAACTRKAVFCVENGEFFQAGALNGRALTVMRPSGTILSKIKRKIRTLTAKSRS